jgi:hypothetical protein
VDAAQCYYSALEVCRDLLASHGGGWVEGCYWMMCRSETGATAKNSVLTLTYHVENEVE